MSQKNSKCVTISLFVLKDLKIFQQLMKTVLPKILGARVILLNMFCNLFNSKNLKMELFGHICRVLLVRIFSRDRCDRSKLKTVSDTERSKDHNPVPM